MMTRPTYRTIRCHLLHKLPKLQGIGKSIPSNTNYDQKFLI